MTETLRLNDLTFRLRRSDRRKTIGITVERDGCLTVAAPLDCPVSLVEKTIRDRSFWVYKKLAQRELLFRPQPPKEYVTGEGFFYLGRSYRLQLVDPDPAAPPLRFLNGRFQLARTERTRAEGHFQAWYTEQGQPWLEQSAATYLDRIGVEPVPVRVRDLGYRWASCGAGGALNFHWRTITLPPSIIEYVVVHELVHLREPHHNSIFWQRLERAMPDFAVRKQWLATHGAHY